MIPQVSRATHGIRQLFASLSFSGHFPGNAICAVLATGRHHHTARPLVHPRGFAKPRRLYVLAELGCEVPPGAPVREPLGVRGFRLWKSEIYQRLHR